MDPVVLFIIIFLVAPILERLLKGSKQQPPPEQRPRRERPPLPRPRPEQSGRPAPEAGQQDEGARAADMLPDDLWEVLTGQRREKPVEPPRRQETPAPVAQQPRRTPPIAARRPQPVTEPGTGKRERRLPTVEMRTELPPDEETQLRKPPAVEQYPVEGYVREIPTYQAPAIVSLEDVDLDEERRHARFHKRVAGLAAPARVQRAREHKLSRLFHQPNELRRAIVMSEVLGPPKGLD